MHIRPTYANLSILYIFNGGTVSSSKENIIIKISEGFPAEKAIRKFKRLCDTYGIVKEYRSREAYSKPSVLKKEKREASEKRRRKTDNKGPRSGKKI